MRDEVVRRIHAREGLACVLGLGYVGLPLALSLVEAGFRVLGVDADYFRASRVAAGLPSSSDVPKERLEAALASGDFEVRDARASNPLCGERPDYAFVCVPTPLRCGQDPDTSAIESAVEILCRALMFEAEDAPRPLVVVLVSTSYPGTARELVAEKLAPLMIDATQPTPPSPLGYSLFVASSPERVDPGRAVDYRTVPRVVGGDTRECTDVAATLLGTMQDRVVRVSSSAAAEMSKLWENTYRAVNIALANEFAIMCDTLGLRTREVLDAASTKPYGFQRFEPGPGVGGHCIPLDPRFLEHRMTALGYRSDMIAAAQRVNERMPQYVGGRIARMLNGAGKAVNGSRVHILGAAYKANVPDWRESPILDLIGWLRAHGCRATYHDPLVPAITLRDGVTEYHSAPHALEPCDLLVLATLHDAVRWREAAIAAPLVFDARGVLGGNLGDGAEQL